ncbi:MAG: ABC transporter permease [Bacteroidaceae bacterium]|nr:ABC transporter permease [Bacteroidaceae bacterium]
MIKIYVKQAWQMMKQQKLFSTIYIIGTALAVCFTLAVVYSVYIRVAGFYPDYDKANTYKMLPIQVTMADGKKSMVYRLSHQTVNDWFRSLKDVEGVTALYQTYESKFVKLPEGKGDYSIYSKFTDPDFFKVCSFTFVEGAPFTEEDFRSGIRNIVITDMLAKRIFGTDRGLVGKELNISFEDYRICGVVKAPSTASSFGFAHVYFPYTSEPGYNALDENMPISGSLTVYLVMKNKAQRDAVWEQLQARIREFNQANQGIMQLELNQRPMSNSQTTLHYMYYQDEQYSKFNLWEVVRYYIYLMFLLLIVPAINLSGMISSRMEDRLPEMGVMKSFGASKSRLLGQVLWENLLLTLIGGLLGLLFLWGGLVIAKNWIFSLFYLWGIDIRPSAEIPFEVPSEVMFSPLLLIAVLLICVAVNVLSALIPAWYALRKPIVFSINQKD